LDIPTKSLRKRKRGATGMTATEINLPAIKSTVYTLCERVTAEYRQEQFVCFVDNLFVNIPLARALLTINIGICGTTRKNALGIPPVLLAIQHRFPELLPDNQVTTCILDDLINVTTWHDGLRENIVTFISTIHRPQATATAKRRSKHLHGTRTTPGGFNTVQARQPAIAIDYNSYMGSTDTINHLRASATVRRPGQPKWTKKFIEFIVDICQDNAYLVGKRNPLNRRRDHRERAFFLQELVNGLVQVQEEAHIPRRRPKRKYCN
jgi:hypothetical protein